MTEFKARTNRSFYVSEDKFFDLPRILQRVQKKKVLGLEAQVWK